MNINIKIKFDDDEKLFLKNIPDHIIDSVVKAASEKGFNAIEQILIEFINIVQLYEYLGDKEGDFN